MELVGTMGRDPFANTADAAAYVPRTATEYVLVSLEMALRDGARVVCLAGPTGSGKSLLLRVLEGRIAEDFASLRVPYSKLDPDEFCRWGLDALGERPSEDPERALAARIERRAAAGGPPLVWVIDDADLLPLPTLQTLLALQLSTGDALRLLFASSRELPAEEFTQVGFRPVSVELEGEMDSDEMTHYVHARLERAGADPAERAQIEAALDRLYVRSHGNPGRLHAAAAALLCFGPDRIAARSEELESALARGVGRAIAAAEEIAAPEEIAASEPAAAAELEVAIESDALSERRVSIESLVAEAVASEPPEEVALPSPEPTPQTALVAPATPTPESDGSTEPTKAPPPGGRARPAPRKRHRLRRLGRR